MSELTPSAEQPTSFTVDLSNVDAIPWKEPEVVTYDDPSAEQENER